MLVYSVPVYSMLPWYTPVPASGSRVKGSSQRSGFRELTPFRLRYGISTHHPRTAAFARLPVDGIVGT
jgi:hypothetical protein